MRLCSAVLAVAVAVMVQETAVASNILFVDLFGSRSHKNFFMSIAELLAQRNHSVTYLTSYEPKRVRQDLREIYIPTTNFFNTLPNLFQLDVMKDFAKSFGESHTYCPTGLDTEEFRRIQDEKFDMVALSMIHAECFLPFVYKQQASLIYMCPNVIQASYSDLAGTPVFNSILPNMMLESQYPFTFTERLTNSLLVAVDVFMAKYLYLPRLEEYCRAKGLYPDGVPSLPDLLTNASLFITNSVRTLEKPTQPYTPTVIHAGGIHCHPAKPLPNDLEEWISGSGDAGFILFSLGTVVNPSDMPEKYRRILVKVFSSLEQRILWKWDENTMEGLPPNVRLIKWIPQQDVLGDHRLRLFITHGGLLSLQEATYHGVPVLGLPVYMDQMYNLRQAHSEGWATKVSWDQLEYNYLRMAILETIHDSRIKEEVNHRSSVMRDQPMSPGAWTSYWVEYVLRHHGATHLQCPAVHMPWYELYNVDVWVTVVVVTVVVLLLSVYIPYKIIRCVCYKCVSPTKTKRE